MITIQTTINAPLKKVWEYYTKPEHITKWNFASSDWCCPAAVNDLKPGGTFSWRMEAKDGSVGFDFEGTYDNVINNGLIEYTIADGRKVSVTFTENTQVIIIFDPEDLNPYDMQEKGWQAILDNFKKYVENN